MSHATATKSAMQDGICLPARWRARCPESTTLVDRASYAHSIIHVLVTYMRARVHNGIMPRARASARLVGRPVKRLSCTHLSMGVVITSQASLFRPASFWISEYPTRIDMRQRWHHDCCAAGQARHDDIVLGVHMYRHTSA